MSQDLSTSLDALTEAGATHKKSTTRATTGFEINGIPINSSTKDGVKYEWVLPRDTGIQASFAQESVGKKFMKIFTSELQTGDPLFDDTVYISTRDKDATAEFLSNEARRTIISDVVSRGGVISVQDKRVSYAIIEDLDPISVQELQMCTFITSLL